jgi:hypothetical protein
MYPLFILLAQGPIRNWADKTAPDPANSGCLVDGVPTFGCIEIVFTNLLFMASAAVGVVLFCMFVYGSFSYLTSMGDSEKMATARKTFTWAIIGLVVFISAGVILWTIDFLFLGGKGTIFEFNLGT